MAHPEELVPAVPETLPEDFNEWDAFAASVPESSASEPETAHAFSEIAGSRSPSPAYPDPLPVRAENYAAPEVSMPAGNSARNEVALSPHGAWNSAPAAAVAEPHEMVESSTNELPSPVSRNLKAAPIPSAEEERASRELSNSRMREADEAIYQLVSMKHGEVAPEPSPSKSKWKVVAAVSACSILLSFALTILLGHHGARAATNQPIQSFSGVTAMQPAAQKPSAVGPLSQPNPQAVADSGLATDDRSAQDDDTANASPALTENQTRMMNDQLAAPRTIQRNAAARIAENAPPPVNLAAASVDGMGGHGAIPNVLNGRAQSVVAAASPRPPVISSGVAVGMLIQKTAPVYPPIAKSARVSGIVELHATIGANGAVKNVYAVKGPEMLRQAALDAVRNWRYKPYELNHQPIEVETTISVSFTLGD